MASATRRISRRHKGSAVSFRDPAVLPEPELGMRWNWSSVYPAPAKLNLFLHVTGRRSDGYHTLQTLFRFVAMYDALRFVPRSDGRIVLANPIPGVMPEADLTMRAAEALRDAAGIRDGVTIHLEKHLPMGGGLGGGSSDAATVLIALNYLWQLGGSRDELLALALPLGADVPVFVFGQSAFAEGIGEALSAVALPPAWYLVIHPGVAVPTVGIFSAPDLRRDTPTMLPTAWASALHDGVGENDLEAVAVARYPEVGAVLDWLRCQSETAGRARMSGSGACVFAAFADEASAQAVAARLPSAVNWRAEVCSGLDVHPLRALLC